MSRKLLLREFGRVVEAPDVIPRLRPFLVELGLRGDLVASTANEASPEPASPERIARGMRSLLQTRPKYRWKPTTAPSSTKRPLGPAGWCSAALGDTGLYINGIPFKPSDWGPSGRPIIRIQNLSGLNGDYNYTTRDCPRDNVAERGDLLVSWSATLDTFIWDGPSAAVNQHIFKVVPNRAAVSPRFLYWLLKHTVRQLAQSQHAHGVAMMHINRGPFLAHSVLIPPIAEQDRIVTVIDQLMALCDQLEAAKTEREARRDVLRTSSLRRLRHSAEASGVRHEDVRLSLVQLPRLITRPGNVAAVREAILDLAVRGGLTRQDPADESAEAGLARLVITTPSQRQSARRSAGGGELGSDRPFELPVGWCWRPVHTLGITQTGGTPATQNPDYYGDAVPFIKPGDIKGSLIDYSGKGLSQAGARALGRHGPADTILMVCIGASLGKCGLADRGCAFNQQINALSPYEPLSPHYLFLALRSPVFQEAVLSASARGTLPIISKGRWEQLLVPVPPLEEQRRVVATVDHLFAVCDELERALAAAQMECGRLVEALLRRALAEGAAVDA